jgi:hypothetical protein
MPARATALNAIAFCGLALYLLLGSFFFYAFVRPSLKGTNGWVFNLDGIAYMQVADQMRSNGVAEETAAVVSLARNMIVPSLEGALLQTKTRIATFNLVVFLLTLVILARTFSPFKWYLFLPIIFLSPTTYEALTTLNKEIFVFLSAAIMARWFKTRSIALMTFLILFSMALRWEQAFVILCFLVLLWLKITPSRAIAIVVIGISVLYPFAIDAIHLDLDPAKDSSSALFAQINLLQGYGLYFLLLIPKLLITLLSQVVRFWTPFVDSERLHILPTGLFVLFDQLSMCLLLAASFCKRAWVKENPAIYFVLLYVAIYLAAPENSPRYLYLLFVLVATVLSSPELQSLRIAQGT